MRDYLGGSARLHHLAFWVDSREDELRAADLMNDAGVPIEAGPARHIPIAGKHCKPGWGARLPSTFRHYGTPPVGAPEEAVTSDWPSPG